MKNFSNKISKKIVNRKKLKFRKINSNLETNQFDISANSEQVQSVGASSVDLSELPHFSFLSQQDSENLGEKKSTEDHISRPEGGKPISTHGNLPEPAKTSQKQLQSESQTKSAASKAAYEPTDLDTFIVFKMFSKNEDKCEITTAKTFCIDSDHNVSSNSYHSVMHRLKHLVKSKERAKFKLDLKITSNTFTARNRHLVADISVNSPLLYDRSANSHFIENNCQSDEPADARWDQSLRVKPFANYVEILPSSKPIFALKQDSLALNAHKAFAISLYLKANTETETLKQDSSSDPDQLNIHLDSKLYREKLPDNEPDKDSGPDIENEESPVNLQLLELSRSEYLSYKSSNYYEIKNNVRKNKYFEINRQCILASLPGVLDIFVDSETTRILVKLHLSDRHGNHQFKLFRSRGALGRHMWKHLVVQVDHAILEIYLDSVLDSRVHLAEFGISFRKFSEKETVPETISLFRHFSSLDFKHNGLILGNLDRMAPKDNLDRVKYERVYNNYKSKSLLDHTNQEYFRELTAVCSLFPVTNRPPPAAYRSHFKT